jgi:hypothetical protein
MDERLADGRKYLLDTNSPTWIDFHFAAMVGLGVFPDNYGGAGINPESSIKMGEDVKGTRIEEISLNLRNSKSGKFALRLFEEFRYAKL